MILAFKYAKTDKVAAEIYPFLFLGSVGAAMHKVSLQESGITHVLAVADGIKPRFPELFTYKCIDFLDLGTADLLGILPECFDYIEQAQALGGKVLLHCFAGKSRSASVCIAYVMRNSRISLLEAFRYVRERRNCAMPNTGFMKQLKIYEESLGIASG
jgi:protein-tyrosine phosphatase